MATFRNGKLVSNPSAPQEQVVRVGEFNLPSSAPSPKAKRWSKLRRKAKRIALSQGWEVSRNAKGETIISRR